jgi:hypothetical protein
VTEPEASVIAGVTAAAIAERASALGLTWKMRPGEVQVYSDSGKYVNVIIDGDTLPLGCLNMIGPIQPGSRVNVMILPEGVNYIVGRLDYYAPMTLMATDSSTTSSGATAVELVVLTISNFVWRAKHAYYVDFINDIQSSTGTNACIWRIRTVGLAGTQLGIGVWPLRNSGASDDKNSNMIIKNDLSVGGDIVQTIVLTLAPTAGTINRLAAVGQVAYLRIFDVGPSSLHTLAVQIV